MKKIYPAIDLLKYGCAILVILVHASTFLSIQDSARFLILNVLGRVAVPIFFLCSGFFFYQNMSMKGNRYVKYYCLSLIKGYLLWSLLYLPIGFLWVQENLLLPWYLYPIALLVALLYTGIYYPLWYVPALLGSILMLYLWQKHFSVKYLLIIAFIFLGFGALETYYGLLPDGLLKSFFQWYIQWFITTRNALFFGLFYVSMGYYIAMNQWCCRKHFTLPCILISFLALYVEAGILVQSDRLDFNILLMAAPLAISIFLFTKEVHLTIDTTKIRLYSESYYYLHGFILACISGTATLQTPMYAKEYSNILYLIMIFFLTHYCAVCMMKLQHAWKTRTLGNHIATIRIFHFNKTYDKG